MRAYRGKTNRPPDPVELLRLMRELLPGYRPPLTSQDVAALRRAERLYGDREVE